MTTRFIGADVDDFVSSLNDVVEAAIPTDVRFRAGFIGDGRRIRIEASRLGVRTRGFPLVRPDENSAVPVLLLRARYAVEMAEGREHLRVVTSSIGLWVDATGGRRKHRPLMRLEYDRCPRAADRAAAHVHLHANSPEMAWVYGSSGRAAPDLHALHFPVGAQRFRPTLEDFLLFLNRERLYTDFKPNWKPTVLRSLQEWRARQAAASAQKYPDVAADALTKLGYTVDPPADGASYRRNT